MGDSKKEGLCEISCVNEDAVRQLRKQILNDEVVSDLSQLFKTLGDPTRLNILNALSKKELCVCDIAAVVNMSQSAISHQLRVLRSLRLVKYRKEGKMALYSLDDEHVLVLFSQGLEHINHR